VRTVPVGRLPEKLRIFHACRVPAGKHRRHSGV
jgi:hypothetical protein